MNNEILIGVIAASSALAGALLSQLTALATGVLERRHARRLLLREKYEELASCLDQSLVWANEVISSCRSPELHAHSQPMSARRIYVLSLIYFPLLKQHAAAYLQACVDFQHAITAPFRAEIPETVGAQAARNGVLIDASSKLSAARKTLDDEIASCAAKYASA